MIHGALEAVDRALVAVPRDAGTGRSSCDASSTSLDTTPTDHLAS